MHHPSDVEAWRHFDRTYLDFAKESCNIHLGLCADGFAPYGQFGRTYSCCAMVDSLQPFTWHVHEKTLHVLITSLSRA